MADPTGWKKFLYRLLFLGFLVGLGIFIWSLYLPFHAPQLLPLPPANPTSDGSYPELLIRYAPASSGQSPFEVLFTTNAPTLKHDSPLNQFEVNLSTGKFVVRQTDLFSGGAIPLALTRTYKSFDSASQSFGLGANQNYDVCPFGSRFPYTYIDLEMEDGELVHFDRISKGTGYTDAIYEHRTTSSKEFFGARIHWYGDGWDLTLPDGSTYVFPEAYYAHTVAQCATTEIKGASGQRIEVNRKHSGDIENVISSTGHRIDFSYDDSGRIVEAHDDLGNDRRYSYDSDGRILFVSDANSRLYQFAYDHWLMTRIMDGSRNEILAIVYRGSRAAQVLLADGELYRFRYDVDSQDNVVRTVVVGPDGTTKEFNFR
jgi:YD repeat-containing protein